MFLRSNEYKCSPEIISFLQHQAARTEIGGRVDSGVKSSDPQLKILVKTLSADGHVRLSHEEKGVVDGEEWVWED